MLNILLVTQNDPFYVPIFFKELLKKNFSYKFNLVEVIIPAPLGKKSFKKLILQMFDFYGFQSFGIIGIKFIVFTIDPPYNSGG